MSNNFNNPDICLDRIKVLYISKNTIDKNDINSIKKAVEKKLEYMAEHLYGEFYEQKFVYEITGEQDNALEVRLVHDQNIKELTDKMFIVND